LELVPAFPKELGQIWFVRRFRGAAYRFDIALDPSLPVGELNLTLNGKFVVSNRIPVQPAGTESDVVVRFNRRM
jgi:hypothetical protein